VRQLVSLEGWLVLLLTVVALAKPLLNLTASLGWLRPGSGYGSARLASKREVRALRARRQQAGMRLGRVDGRTIALPEPEVYEHVLVCGPPGSGKSSGLIIPNILAERGTRSLVIVDPKSELATRTRGAVSRHSEVWLVNFLDPRQSRGYNPLAYVTDYLSAEAFADCWITNTGRSSRDPFWDNAAKQLIVAAILHLRAEVTRIPTLADLAGFFTRHDAETITAMFAASKAPVAQDCASSFLASMSKNDKLLGSVFTELPPRFSILRDERVAETTSRHQVIFSRLASTEGQPVALYLALERTMAPLLKPLSACFFMQLFHELIRIADASREGILPRPVFGYLDEFGNIGSIPDMTRWMSTVRSAKLGFLLAVQDLAQLGVIYGREGRQIITTDCATKIALAGVSGDDAEWFSRASGVATVLAHSANHSRNRGDRLARSGSRGVSEVARPLLTPAEVTRLRPDTMLVLAGTRQPLLVRQQRWYRDGHLRRLGHLAPPTGTSLASTSLVEVALKVAQRSVPLPGLAASSSLTATDDDGAIRLGRGEPAGEATWVTEPPVSPTEEQPVDQPLGTATAGAAQFELPQDS
jgi:type IV secretion system protein VirD4